MEQPDTIDPVEFLRNSAIKWQLHARTTYAVIEIMRDDPANFDADDIIQAQRCYATESEVARERLEAYIYIVQNNWPDIIKEYSADWITIDGPAW